MYMLSQRGIFYVYYCYIIIINRINMYSYGPSGLAMYIIIMHA